MKQCHYNIKKNIFQVKRSIFLILISPSLQKQNKIFYYFWNKNNGDNIITKISKGAEAGAWLYKCVALLLAMTDGEIRKSGCCRVKRLTALEVRKGVAPALHKEQCSLTTDYASFACLKRKKGLRLNGLRQYLFQKLPRVAILHARYFFGRARANDRAAAVAAFRT